MGESAATRGFMWAKFERPIATRGKSFFKIRSGACTTCSGTPGRLEDCGAGVIEHCCWLKKRAEDRSSSL